MVDWEKNFWAPDGAYSRFIPGPVMVVWLAVVSTSLVRRYSAAATSDRTALAAP